MFLIITALPPSQFWLDASQGAVQGVRANANADLHAVATKEEVAETLRVTQYVCGVGSAYLATPAPENMF